MVEEGRAISSFDVTKNQANAIIRRGETKEVLIDILMLDEKQNLIVTEKLIQNTNKHENQLF
jgi:hypothetical protein